MAKKMKLVPQHLYDRIMAVSQDEDETQQQVLRREKKQVIELSNVPEDIKRLLYQNVQRRYVDEKKHSDAMPLLVKLLEEASASAASSTSSGSPPRTSSPSPPSTPGLQSTRVSTPTFSAPTPRPLWATTPHTPTWSRSPFTNAKLKDRERNIVAFLKDHNVHQMESNFVQVGKLSVPNIDLDKIVSALANGRVSVAALPGYRLVLDHVKDDIPLGLLPQVRYREVLNLRSSQTGQGLRWANVNF
jgi:hypothetical protein